MDCISSISKTRGIVKGADHSEFEANRKILGGDVKQKKTGEMPVRKIKMTSQRSKLHRKVTRQQNKKFQKKGKIQMFGQPIVEY